MTRGRRSEACLESSECFVRAGTSGDDVLLRTVRTLCAAISAAQASSPFCTMHRSRACFVSGQAQHGFSGLPCSSSGTDDLAADVAAESHISRC